MSIALGIQIPVKPAPVITMRKCGLCGEHRPPGLMVADGRPEWPETRWYCADIRDCTRRWTEAQP